jgi:hypothetical protein
MPASLVLALEGVEAIEHVRDDGQGGPRNVVHEVVADRRDVYRPGGVADRFPRRSDARNHLFMQMIDMSTMSATFQTVVGE